MRSRNGLNHSIAAKVLVCAVVACLGAGLVGCDSQPESAEQAKTVDAISETAGMSDAENTEQPDGQAPEIIVLANGHELRANLEDNPSAQALAELLASGSLTVAMHDYGDMEKVGAIGQSLPTSDAQITTAPGDIILYQGNQLTIYYDVNTWNLTRIGRIEGVSDAELKDILGDGDVEVTFALA